MRRYARNHARHRYMRINRLLGLAVLIALAVASIIPGAANAATPQAKSSATSGRHLDYLASGTLIDAYGKPTQGSGTVWLNELGASKTLRAVSAFRTTSNGAFSVSYPTVSSYIKKAASRNNGYVGFFVGAGNSSAKVDYAFTSRLVNGAWDGSGIKNARLAANVSLTSKEQEAASEFNRRLAVSPDNAPPHMDLGQCVYNLKAQHSAYTMIGELHTSFDQIESVRYTSGGNADTDISVGIKVGGSFEAGGNIHIGDASSGEIGTTVGADYGRGYQTQFTYGKYKIDGLSTFNPNCWSAPSAIKIATSWDGGDAVEGWQVHYLDHHCGDTYRQYAVAYRPGGHFARTKSKLTWYSGAVNVLGFGFDTQTGASEDLTYRWDFGDNYPLYWICGSNDTPPSALRIYTGY